MNNWNEKYKLIIFDILKNGFKSYNERTKSSIIKKFGISFKLKNVDYIPLLTIRKMRLQTVAAELAWMLSGTKSIKWLNKYTSIWKKFEKPEGIIESAYGYRWTKEFNRNQIDELIKMFKIDRSSRHGVVMSWDPKTDGLMGKRKTNIPCPFCFVSNIIEDRLNMHIMQRSADMILGLPYDVAVYSMLNICIAKSLGFKSGDIYFSITDAHIYSNQFEIGKKLTKICYNDFEEPFQGKTISYILNNKDNFVKYCNKYYKKYDNYDYDPKVNIMV